MKEKILNEIETLVSDFCYKDLNEAFENGDITIDEMVEKFREGLNNNFN